MIDVLRTIVLGGLFAIPFLAIYVENEYFFPFITGKNFWFRIIVDVVIVGWVILALLDAKYRPKFSWILSGFGALIVVMFFANLYGVHPNTSFWSNFERMDGYITLVHVFLYFLALGSMLTTRSLWLYYLNTSLVVAFFVGLYGLAQAAGIAEARARVDSWLGNAAYLAIYMLFHIFVALWLFVESKAPVRRLLYAVIALMFVYVLFETGTRGTFIGMIAGIGAMTVYVALFGSKVKQFRQVAIGSLAVVLVLVASLFALRDASFVQENNSLRRIANINLQEDLEVRMTIWGLALDGVAERPLLGWGQNNFNYIFNQNYDPFLYDQEQWFDRAHNIFVDWLVAGGWLGLISYLSIFVACAYYLFVRPLLRPDDESFTVLERAVLIGILVGYFTHNLVVFDNIVSYMFFGMILALIHARVATPIPALMSLRVPQNVVQQVAAPALVVVLGVVIYTVHLPGMYAAGDIIDAFSELRSQDPAGSLEAFERALGRETPGTFGHQEITEQLAQQAMNLARAEGVPDEIRQQFLAAAERELAVLVEQKPNDARVHVFVGSFYRAIGNVERAREEFARARELSPQKQSIILQEGLAALAAGDIEAANTFFADGLALDERNLQMREFYALTLLNLGQVASATALVESDAIRQHLAGSDYVVSAAEEAEAYDFLIDLFEVRVASPEATAQTWATLAFLYYRNDDIDGALQTLDRAASSTPEFAPTAQCFSENIEAGRDPQEGC